MPVKLFGVFCSVMLFISVGALLEEKRTDAHEGYAFTCAINCMDGRTHEAVIAYMRDHYYANHPDFAETTDPQKIAEFKKLLQVDMITEPGPCKVLADDTDAAIIANIKKRVGISVNKHHSKVIAIVAHPECAGNPVERQQQLKDLCSAMKTVKSFGFKAEIILLWVNEDWKTVERINAPDKAQ